MRISDWSSDVCSSDLLLDDRHAVAGDLLQRLVGAILGITHVGRPVALLHLRGLGEIKIVERTSRRVAKHLEHRGALGRQTSCRPGNLTLVVARSEEHTSELQSLMRISYAVFCLTKKNQNNRQLQ